MSTPYCKIVYGVAIPDNDGENNEVLEELRLIATKEENTPRDRYRNVPKFHYVYCGLNEYCGFHYIGIDLMTIDVGCNHARFDFVQPTETQKSEVQAFMNNVLSKKELKLLGSPVVLTLCGVG